VVVMAENDKGQMDDEVRAALSGFKNLTWHTRTGAPHCVSDLEGIAAGQAQTIILLHPETIEVARHLTSAWMQALQVVLQRSADLNVGTHQLAACCHLEALADSATIVVEQTMI
jgi:hypothetical protein